MNLKNLGIIASLILSATATHAAVIDLTFTATNAFVEWQDVVDDGRGDPIFANGDTASLSFQLDTDADVEEVSIGVGTTDVRYDIFNVSLDINGTAFDMDDAFSRLFLVDIGSDSTTTLLEVQTARGLDGAPLPETASLSDYEIFAEVFFSYDSISADGANPDLLRLLRAVDDGSATQLDDALEVSLTSEVGMASSDACFALCFGFFDGGTLEVSGLPAPAAPSPVPLPASAWLLLAGLGGLGAMRGRKRAL